LSKFYQPKETEGIEKMSKPTSGTENSREVRRRLELWGATIEGGRSGLMLCVAGARRSWPEYRQMDTRLVRQLEEFVTTSKAEAAKKAKTAAGTVQKEPEAARAHATRPSPKGKGGRQHDFKRCAAYVPAN
jgi:hypothetical protein